MNDETIEDPATIAVVAAVIERQGAWLICQRPADKRHGGRWEFPGGKLQGGETLAQGARRELAEELDVAVTSVGPCLFEATDPGSPYLVKFCPVVIVGEPRALEHQRLAWVKPRDLDRYDLAPTDRRFVSHRARHWPKTHSGIC